MIWMKGQTVYVVMFLIWNIGCSLVVKNLGLFVSTKRYEGSCRNKGSKRFIVTVVKPILGNVVDHVKG